MLFRSVGEDDKALNMFEKALKTSSISSLVSDTTSNSWKPYAIIGNIYIKRAEYEKGFEYWEKAFQALPKLDVIQGLIDLAFQLRKIDKLKFYLEYLKQKYPYHKNHQNDILYANVLFNENKIEESIKILLTVPDGKVYIDQFISGCLSLERFDDVALIQEIVSRSV